MRVKNIKRKSFRQRIFLITAIMIFMAMPLYVHAADLKILSTVVFDGNIYIYIRGIAELNRDCEIPFVGVRSYPLHRWRMPEFPCALLC